MRLTCLGPVRKHAGAGAVWETTDNAGYVCWVGREIGSDGIKRKPVLCEEILGPGRMGSGPSGQGSIAPMSFSL